MKNKLVHFFIIGIFCSLYFLVATISMINSVAFFDLAHDGIMNWALAVGFELGAAASLAAIIILDKTNKTMVWSLFILLTAFQMMANSFHAFVHLENYMPWIELFGLEEEEPIFQKRILSIVSGAVLPLVALGFIKSLVDYIRPEDTIIEKINTEELEPPKPKANEDRVSHATLQSEDTIVEKTTTDSTEEVKSSQPKINKIKVSHVTVQPEVSNVSSKVEEDSKVQKTSKRFIYKP
jgi:hypothetical protein